MKASLFDFCLHSKKPLDDHECPGLFQTFFHGKVRKGRKMVDGLVYIDEYVKCSCLCHIPADERPKPKKTRKTAAKKTATKRKK